jgi:hypothetical protein
MPSHIQSQLPEYTFEQVCERLNGNLVMPSDRPRSILDQKTVYLAHLCARGDVEKVKSFIRETDRHELNEILNNDPVNLFCGSVLHTVLFWNSDHVAIELFDLLVQHGAEYTRNYYEECPWEQVGTVWFTVLPGPEIPGKRDPADFQEVYRIIQEIYRLDAYQEANPIRNFWKPVEQDEDEEPIGERIEETWKRAAEEIPV